ncbi:MAG: putative nucleic acid-binding protein contains PIN [Geobacteraceae bacterium]|nr:MAG: putative nucleic acid-binding protein contains PIN [Geobacteraceae bacterium]
MKPVLVDTDVLINFLRGKQKAKEFLLTQLDSGPILCSVITVAEIFAGMRPHEQEKTRALLDNLEVVPVTRTIAEKAGLYKRVVKSHSLELDDCLIAATAHLHKATLATGNDRHYPMDDISKTVVTCE